ncbi:hypothetical protein HGRIS_014177 [Hohenbuehelia grisea]|uniref:Uncharacterized protein n=1 Tax=Hohenbuehelia grisea TaxID=104357 RepID=A0ABR3JSQ3_9AGAR
MRASSSWTVDKLPLGILLTPQRPIAALASLGATLTCLNSDYTNHDCHIPAGGGDGEPALALQPNGGAGLFMDGFTGNDASSYQHASIPAGISPSRSMSRKSSLPPRENCSAVVGSCAMPCNLAGRLS